MKKRQKAIGLSLMIAALGVVIGFLGELMPDDFKAQVASFTQATFGVSFIKIWITTVALVVLVFLVLVWREASRENDPEEGSTGGAPKAVFKGRGGIFIEKNDGPINIR